MEQRGGEVRVRVKVGRRDEAWRCKKEVGRSSRQVGRCFAEARAPHCPLAGILQAHTSPE